MNARAVAAGALVVWLPVAVAVTLVAGLVYGAVQQDIRSGANDPQVQVAEDAAGRLQAGDAPATVVPTGQVDLRRSLATAVMVFDRAGKVLASSAVLDGAVPDYPRGVLDNARATGTATVTWQPAGDVRIASVVVPYRDGYVMAGRSMRLVEQREQAIELLVGFAWLVTLGLTGLTALAVAALRRRVVGSPAALAG